MMGSLTATAAAFLGTTLLAACDDSDGGTAFHVEAGSSGATTAGNLVTLTGRDGRRHREQASRGPRSAVRTSSCIGADTNNAAFIAPAVAAGDRAPVPVPGDQRRRHHVGAERVSVTVNPAKLGFAAVAKNLNDVVTVPAGYTVTVMTRLGDPLAAGVPAYANDGTDANFAQRIGDHGDALYWYGLNTSGARDDNGSTRGLLVQNHENLNVQYLHPAGPTNVSAGPRPEAEALKEIEAHGVSVTEYRDGGNRAWSWVQNSAFNRRVTPNTPVVFSGPARGSDFLKTMADTTGAAGTGTRSTTAPTATAAGAPT